MGQVRYGSGTIEPARRHRFGPAGEGTLSEQQCSNNDGQSANGSTMARRIARFGRRTERGTGRQTKDSGEVGKRAMVEDMKIGPRELRWTVLTEEEAAAEAAFRPHTLLPSDPCLYPLQPANVHLTRAALRRCLLRHGISRLPDVDGDKPKRQKFKR